MSRCQQPSVVGKRLGISSEPQPETAGHSHLQMGVTGHEHVLMLVTQQKQAVEEVLHVVGNLTQLGAIEKLQVDEHLIVA